MQRRLILITAIILATPFSMPSISSAESRFVADTDLLHFVREADLIIEGGVDTISEEVAKTVPQYVGQGRHQILLDFGTVAAVDVAVDNVLKGPARDSQRIRVYAKPDFTGTFDALLPNRRYVLFLKKHRFKEGYEVMDQGRLEWVVFDYEGSLKVRSSSQLPKYRPADQYMDYADLIQQIKSSLSHIQKSK